MFEKPYTTCTTLSFRQYRVTCTSAVDSLSFTVTALYSHTFSTATAFTDYVCTVALSPDSGVTFSSESQPSIVQTMMNTGEN